ncbi:MAG: MATE family efflux transporter [Candidatus Zixiibacteriota bacterium]
MAADLKQSDRIISGPIVRTVFSLAIPVVLGMLMEFALHITDLFWVGMLGPAAQDAITTSMVVIWTVFAFIALISVGITALVSRYIGARDLDKTRFYINQGMMLAVFLGLLFSIIGYLVAPYILKFMGPGEKTLVQAIPYLRIFLLSAIFYTLVETAYAVFRASGDTRTPTYVGVLAIVINLVLDPVLIFGLGPIPAMGVKGASIASSIAIFVAVAIILFKIYTGRLGYEVTSIFKHRPNVQGMLKITKIGLPVSSQQFVFLVVYWFLIRIVHQFGDTAGAAMGIGNRMESLSYLTCHGFALAASTMVGQNLGAKNPDRAAKGAWIAAGLAISLTAVIAVFFVSIPNLIASIFTDNAEVTKIAADYLFILGLSQFTMALEIVLEGAFSGAGNTVPPMVVSIPGALSRIPLAYFLCFDLGWGINGVWWTLTITTTVKSLILASWFKLGRWKSKEV